VWFDSGTTHETVLNGSHAEQSKRSTVLGDADAWSTRNYADMYLEGSDQHRGWFHSSLLTSSMINGRAPYKALLTHGFVVDQNGRKMSKSLGNVVAPQKVCDSLGAEILRLWVAATDYSGELALSDEILKRVTETYRRIRNTLRFLLANTSDFDVSEDAVPLESLSEIDRYAIAMTRKMAAEVTASYARYEFHVVMQQLQSFCSDDLGSFYLDILKDRLYTCGTKSPARRSAQTALHHITQTLVRLMAPVMSFTAEEIWSTLNPGKSCVEASVFFETWKQTLPEPANEIELVKRWSRLREIRGYVNGKIETLRAASEVGSSLQAEVTIEAPMVVQGAGGEVVAQLRAQGDVAWDGIDFDLLSSLGDDLKFVFITSSVVIKKASDSTGRISVRPSSQQKCDRCWHYRSDVGQDAKHAGFCARCIGNLYGEGEKRAFA
jgi:isoleucyl-tRNA synthetase